MDEQKKDSQGRDQFSGQENSQQDNQVGEEETSQVHPEEHEKFQAAQPVQPVQESIVGEGAQVQYVGFWMRGAAVLVDVLIIGVIQAVIGFAVGFLLAVAKMDSVLIDSIMPIVISATVMYGYFILLTKKYSATIGKKLLGIAVASEKSDSLSWGQVVLREFLGRIVNIVTITIGYIMAGITDRKRGLHDMIADTVVVYKDPSKKRIWLVILIYVGVVVVWLGFVASIALTSLNVTKNKATDVAMKSTISAIMVDLVVHNDNTGSYANYVVPADVKSSVDKLKSSNNCVSDPVVVASANGNMVAVYAKSCVNKSVYFCLDSSVIEVVDVTKDYMTKGKASCTGADESALPEAAKEDVSSSGVDEIGMNLSVSGDANVIAKATEVANTWQPDAVPYALSRLLDEESLKDINIVTFKSKNRSGKIFTVGLAMDGIVSGTGETVDNIEGTNPLDLSEINISSSEAYEKINETMESLDIDLNKYERIFFLSNVKDVEKGENINMWACTLINSEDPSDAKVIIVNAKTGEVAVE
ncbi:RDD family protein [Patescibacteria group bacterium]